LLETMVCKVYFCRPMKKNIDITKFLDGTEFGRLKVRVFVYLNERYSEKPEDLDKIKEEVIDVFQVPDSETIAEQWYNLTFE